MYFKFKHSSSADKWRDNEALAKLTLLLPAVYWLLWQFVFSAVKYHHTHVKKWQRTDRSLLSLFKRQWEMYLSWFLSWRKVYSIVQDCDFNIVKSAVCGEHYVQWRLFVLDQWMREPAVCVGFSLCCLLVPDNFMQHTSVWYSFFLRGGDCVCACLRFLGFQNQLMFSVFKQKVCNWWWGSLIHSTVFNGFYFFLA